MAQRSHVPKFGNWDDDQNVPYTVYFENARKEKVGGVRMNPNDPEENPEAFMFGGLINGGDSSPASPVPLQRNLDKPTSSGKNHIEGHKQHYSHRRNSSDQQKSISQKSIASESSSDKSNYENLNPRSNHHRKRSEGKKSPTESSNGFFPLSPARNRARGGSNESDDLSYKSVSVPKFGAWDERDPKSGEGFTVIFNKVKEEKQIVAAKFPPVQQPQTSIIAESPRRDTSSKMFCCLFRTERS